MHKYIEIISGIMLKIVGHAPGLAFLIKASLGLFRTLVRGFSSFSQIDLSFTLLTLGLGHQLVRTVSESSRIYMKCTCMSCVTIIIYYLLHYKVVKYFLYISLGNRLQSIIQINYFSLSEGFAFSQKLFFNSKHGLFITAVKYSFWC